MKKALIILAVLSLMGCAARKQYRYGKSTIDTMNNLDTLSAKQFKIYTIKK